MGGGAGGVKAPLFQQSCFFKLNQLFIYTFRIYSYSYSMYCTHRVECYKTNESPTISSNCTFKNVYKQDQKCLFYSRKYRVSEPEPSGAGLFGWSRSRHFGPAPYCIFV